MKKLILLIFVLFIGTISLRSQSIQLSLTSYTACIANDSITISVNTTAITAAGAISLKIKYNPAVLQLGKTMNWAPGLTGIQQGINNSTGTLGVSWVLTAYGVNVAPGKLFDLRFKYLGGNSAVYFSQVLGDNEIADEEGIIISMTSTDGIILDGRPNVDLSPSISTTICNGDSILLKATNNQTFTYQWFKDNSVIPAINNDSIFIKNAGLYKVKVSSVCGDSTTNSTQININYPPVQPGNIIGQNSVCEGITGISYTINPVPAATNYSWTVPPSWSIISGNGTNSILVDFPMGSVNGNLKVIASNSCGNSPEKLLNISINAAAPLTPGNISGAAVVCQSDTAINYSIASVANATSYIWNLSSGLSLQSSGSSNSEKINFSSNSLSENLTVIAVNGCGNSPASTAFLITVNPTPIAQISSTSVNLCNGDSMILHTNPNSNYSYVWYKDGIILPGKTDSLLTINSGGNYTNKITTNLACSDISDSYIIQSLSLPIVDFSGLSNDYCINNSSSNLTGSPLGGIFTGSGISSSVFNPGIAGDGNHSVTYTYTDANQCSASKTYNTTVYVLPIVELSSLTSKCANNSSFSLSGGSPIGGLYSGVAVSNGTFDPLNSGSGNFMIYYSFTDAHNCSNLDSTQITIHSIPQIEILNLDSEYCIDAINQTINVNPVGGILSGDGVSSYVFSPFSAGYGIHNINYQYTDGNGCSNSIYKSTRVDSIPMANAGSDITINLGGSGTTLGSSCNNDFSYLWSPSMGLSASNICNPWANPALNTSYILQVTNHACTNKDTVDITVNSTFNISGKLVYHNASETPLINTKIYLKDSLTLIDSCITDLNGNYNLAFIPNGIYTLEPLINYNTGGYNGTDALIVQRHSTSLLTLTGMYFNAGDVNGSGYLNSTDALYIKRRFTGLLSSFSAGSWLFDSLQVQVQAANVSHNIRTLCYGDVNGSFSPVSSKIQQKISINPLETESSQASELVEIPVYYTEDKTIGAISIILKSENKSLQIKDLILPQELKDESIFKISDNTVSFVFHSLNALKVKKGDKLFTLIVNCDNEQAEDLNAELIITGESEFANQFAESYENFNLTYPILKKSISYESGISVYPNPTNDNIYIQINSNTNENCKIECMNILGETVVTQSVFEIVKGENKFRINTTEFSKGVYFFKIQIGQKQQCLRFIKQ